jgi:phosphonate degradation associated HDIG domain protein
MTLTLHDIEALFDAKGERAYRGEPVTQIEHALQTAQRAEAAGAGDALITAALLHDLGHLLNDQGETPTLRGIDDRHEYVAIPRLRDLFADNVLAPIRMHVEAKRFLCARGDRLLGGRLSGAEYLAALSADSLRSLQLQGGVFTAREADAFIAQPFAADALRVRVWDDAAKIAGAVTPPLDHFMAIARRASRPRTLR